MPFLIQGFFFQDIPGLDIAYKPAEGAVAVVRTGTRQCMYADALWEANGMVTGRMEDRFGVADLSEIFMSETRVRFTKIYEKERERPISYTFSLHGGNVWIGEYASPHSGIGITLPQKCFLCVPAIN